MDLGKNSIGRAAAAVAVGAWLAVMTASAASAAFPGSNGKIAFQSTRAGGDYEIVRMHWPNGGHAKRLTGNNVDDLSPSWSPDGRKLAFSENIKGDLEIMKMDADGSHMKRLTHNGVDDDEPAWSPNGSKLTFARKVHGKNWEIMKMSANGSNITRLTNDGKHHYPDEYPAWSPDGTKIAFDSRRSGGYQVFTMNRNGSHQIPLTGNPGVAAQADWSPDGTQIAYTGIVGQDIRIWVMNADGSNQVAVSPIGDHSPAADPAWSPDGTRIAYARFYGANFTGDIFRMNVSGTNEVRLTKTKADDWLPDWQPVG